MMAEGFRKALENAICCCVSHDRQIGIVDDGLPVPYPVRIGASILLCGKRKASFPFHCLIGPDWPAVCIVFILIIVVNAVILWAISPLGWPPVLIGIIGAILLLLVYSVTVFSNPGIVFKNDYPFELDSITPGAYATAAGNTIATDVEQRDSAPANTVHNTTHNTIVNSATNNNTINVVPLISDITGSVVTRVSPGTIRTVACGQCNFQRPPTAKHCPFCKNCIQNLDHHCPW